METYEIKSDYVHRTEEKFLKQHYEIPTTKYEPYPTRAQKHVYKYALQVCNDKKYKKVIDIGTGSGINLIRFFNEFETIGYDLPGNVDWLKQKYPTKDWRLSDFTKTLESSDLIICADVIEHILEPNSLLEWMKDTSKDIIISTPNRDMLKNQDGPPTNKYHIREWSFEEFEQYISRHFKIEKHWTNGIHQIIHTI
jgi:2-polyprenyl-3-methyl-5-hydroxy-6-metoxy-1,4-benzoquinol methylase